MAKPEKTTLYTKAGPDGKSLGDCPFSHTVQMALKLKGVEYDVVPCTQDTKPQWLLEEVGGKMPCVLHEGVPHVETSEILAWIDATFAEPALAVPGAMEELLKGRFGVFPGIAGFTKNTDDSKDAELKAKLLEALGRLAAHLKATPGGFLCGKAPSLADCDVLTKLYVLQNATAHYKKFSLDSEDLGADGEVLREYYARASQLPAFSECCYPGDVCHWGWGQARGA
eukprot:TRINITY_DN84316_c0_g1_i1.p1 TRINITY_DN84316_c0_g1~~TRINITY_DN84316_c0_g1_i1.p1  ORF type:complete len:226 (+),score=45.72 TRINITY_DN84316_c0_g1_i1:67-744(+)